MPFVLKFFESSNHIDEFWATIAFAQISIPNEKDSWVE
jgi:hypothetical protein